LGRNWQPAGKARKEAQVNNLGDFGVRMLLAAIAAQIMAVGLGGLFPILAS